MHCTPIHSANTCPHFSTLSGGYASPVELKHFSTLHVILQFKFIAIRWQATIINLLCALCHFSLSIGRNRPTNGGTSERRRRKLFATIYLQIVRRAEKCWRPFSSVESAETRLTSAIADQQKSKRKHQTLN